MYHLVFVVQVDGGFVVYGFADSSMFGIVGVAGQGVLVFADFDQAVGIVVAVGFVAVGDEIAIGIIGDGGVIVDLCVLVIKVDSAGFWVAVLVGCGEVLFICIHPYR